jgi:hypothetical protein
MRLLRRNGASNCEDIRRVLCLSRRAFLIFTDCVGSDPRVLPFDDAATLLPLKRRQASATHVILTREDPDSLNSFFGGLLKTTGLRWAFQLVSLLIYKITALKATSSWNGLELPGRILPMRPTYPGSGDPGSGSRQERTGQVRCFDRQPAVWQGAVTRYLYRVNRQWKIAGMKQTQINLEPDRPVPTISP